jgi:vacuolar-type H+-ATPase subunit C/Vma6
MSVHWEAIGARAGGLSAHLLPDEKLERLGRVPGIADLVRELEGTPYAPFLPARGGSTGAIELGVTRSLAHRVATLARWAARAGADRALSPLFLELDVANVRVVLRGVLGELTTEQRLSGAIPTPTLGRRPLEVLAGADSVGAVAASLVAWGHPLGPPLLSAVRRVRPDLFGLEAVLLRCWAGHASSVARSGGPALVRFVADTIDAQNAIAALVLAGAHAEGPPEPLFVGGGARLGVQDFAAAAAAVDRPGAAERLARPLRGTPLAVALAETAGSPASVSSRVQDAHIERLARERRREPLTVAPVLLFVLRLRREARLVRGALWRVGLTGARP